MGFILDKFNLVSIVSSIYWDVNQIQQYTNTCMSYIMAANYSTSFSGMNFHAMHEHDPFLTAFHGTFHGVLRWPQLDKLWQQINSEGGNWFVYAVGETPPDKPLVGANLQNVIHELDELLHQEHEEDYCGIVYADSLETPTFVKVFDPNNLGSTCGSSGNPPLPGWIISKIQPINLPSAMPQPGNRRRWWQKLFGYAY